MWNFLQDTPLIPHGMCLQWEPTLLGLHVTSDLLIALSYYSIPFSLIYFICRRRDIGFRFVFYCFAIFIVACGTTHIMDIWTIWVPSYYTDGIIRAVTAIASVMTASLVWYLMPELLSIPSRSELEQKNLQLAVEVQHRIEAENEAVQLANSLESRVQERTKELQRLVEEKDAFVRETHHRVRNNLQVMAGLLQLQMSSTQNPDTRMIFEKTLGRIDSMRLVHEQLYQSDLVNISLMGYIKKLCEQISTTYETDVEVFVEGDDGVTIDADSSVPIGLACNEVISNSFLHGFPPEHSSPRIHVRVETLDDGRARVVICDNGTGFDLESIESSPDHVGMKLVKGLVRQVHGECKYTIDDGVVFELIVPARLV